jgi:hypothetical protein
MDKHLTCCLLFRCEPGAHNYKHRWEICIEHVLSFVGRSIRGVSVHFTASGTS